MINVPERKGLARALIGRMSTLGIGPVADVVLPQGWRERAGAIAGPGVAVAGVAIASATTGGCGAGGSLAMLPPLLSSVLTAVGGWLWITGMSRDTRDRLVLAVAVALATLAIAGLQEALGCLMGRELAEAVLYLRGAGLALLLVALLVELNRIRRARTARAVGQRPRRRRFERRWGGALGAEGRAPQPVSTRSPGRHSDRTATRRP